MCCDSHTVDTSHCGNPTWQVCGRTCRRGGACVHAAHERAATQEAAAWQMLQEAEADLETRNRARECARQEQEVGFGAP